MPRARDLTACVLDGRYELLDLVGDGAFGRVYRGRDQRLDRIVAVKVIKPWWAEDPVWSQTFEHEARLLARLSDPGIVQIFDVGQAEEGLYYVTEFVDGESLASRLGRGPLAPREACDIAEQLCRALARAHAQRVVHRDIKPANVLLSKGGRVKLGDFGIARLAEGTTGGIGGEVVGTPKYMAPEQARGRRTTPATDVYSVGVVLYEMLAGAPPFAGESVVDLALSHVQDPAPPLPPQTPRRLVEIVERALAKDAAERFPDGRAMAAALGRARAALDIEAHPALPARVNGDSGRRPEPTRVAPRLSPRRDVDPPGRRRTIALLALAFSLLAALGLGAVLLAPGSVRVPNFHGLARSAVVSKTRHLGLRAVFASRFDSAKPGTTVAQTPTPGAQVDDGSVVRVTLSAGPPPVKLPRVIGQDSAQARKTLAALGLTVRTETVPAPGVQPGIVTGQRPGGGASAPAHSQVVLLVAETPSWRALTSLAGTDTGRSVPFRIRGGQWRIVYHMAYVGTCDLIVYCDGPSAQVLTLPSGSAQSSFGLSDGGAQTRVIHSGPGLYQVRVTPGSDTAQWSIQVQDYY
ncbi:MAG TPA: protein kinase [Solirubrobacteraceae bacterium]|nr:protein kinase [Solirubrobacteraceae bacterium]